MGKNTVNALEVIIIVDNMVHSSGLFAEWGFSALLKVIVGEKTYNILFDTSTTDTILLHNMEVLGIKPGEIDYIVLSHGHYDHTGGLKIFLEKAGKKIVIAHPDAFKKKYSLKNGFLRYIGSPFSLEEIRSLSNLMLVRSSFMFVPGVYYMGEIAREGFPEHREDMYMLEEGVLVEDPMLDDTGVAVNVEGLGLVVITGCGHSGVLNIVRHAEKTFGEKVYAVIGGLHMYGMEPDKVYKIFDRLEEWGVKRVAPAHCSGIVAKCQASEIKRGFLLETGSGARIIFKGEKE
ncbi:MAG: hypothetical protein DRJ35_04490 [Thermoprotei archaeon]|nr:MAG: hypothetical protein DRJ35_04490 [Thermoprotei archaeon]